MAASSTADQVQLAHLLSKPKNFARAILKSDPWSRQDDVLDALEHFRRVAVPACHSSGKTYIAAAAVLWFLTRYPDAVVITTAPTWPQVRRLLWANIHSLRLQSGLTFSKVNETELVVSQGNYAVGLSTDEGVRFQGFHSGHILIVLDEAPGVRPDIWEAIEGIRAGGDVRVLALGNPVIPSGTFFDACKDGSGWKVIQIDAFATPNLLVMPADLPYVVSGQHVGESLTSADLQALPDDLLDASPRPYLTNRRWVLEKYLEWGEADPRYVSRVRGRFPDDPADSLIGRTLLQDALDQGQDYHPGVGTYHPATRPVFGIDVAGAGDANTTICLRRGNVLETLWSFAKADPTDDVLLVLGRYRDEMRHNGHYPAIRVDTIGQGYYFARHLEKSGWMGWVVDVNVAQGPETFIDPRDKTRVAKVRLQYHNLKARLYWDLRERFQRRELIGFGLTIQAIEQLNGLRWRENERSGKIEIESKKEMADRGVASPDIAECIMLAFADVRHLTRGVVLTYGKAQMPMGGRR